MKKIFYICFTTLSFALILNALSVRAVIAPETRNEIRDERSEIKETRDEIKTESLNLLQSHFQTPTKLILPSIKVASNIIPVGVTEKGAMDTPKSFFEIGWLTTSGKIGENSNLVLAGHYDTTTGAPAVFYNLSKLIEGDEIVVQSVLPSGLISQKKFKVTSVSYVDPKNTDHVRVAFEKTSNPTITLITCGGVWDTKKQEYSNRVIVKGKLIT